MRSDSGGTTRRIEGLFADGPLGSMSDGRLLERFAGRVGVEREDAFAALVRRHGPMVLGTCRRMLGNAPEADDAFQAVFLVLARKAGSLRGAEDVGAWLRVVAVRTGREARARSARLRSREGAPLDDRHAAPGVDPDLFELRAALDEELERLPGRYRDAIRLCELEGVPRRDAAERLGLAEGTLSSRLARGRSLLRDRLARRGLAVGLLGAALTPPAPASSLPEAALRLALEAIPTGAAPGTVSEAVASLAEGVLAVMALSRWRLLAKATCVLATLALGAGLAWAYAVRPVQPVQDASQLKAGTPVPDEAESPVSVVAQGVVVDETGAPVAGAEVVVDPYMVRQQRGVTGPDGSFAIERDPSWGPARTVLARAEAGRRIGLHQVRNGSSPWTEAASSRIVVLPAREFIVLVTDARGEPTAGATVAVQSTGTVVAQGETGTDGRFRTLVAENMPIELIAARKAAVGFEYQEFGDYRDGRCQGVTPSQLPSPLAVTLCAITSVRVRARDESGRPVQGVHIGLGSLWKPGRSSSVSWPESLFLGAVTGPGGTAVFDWLPEGRSTSSFLASGPGIEGRASLPDHQHGGDVDLTLRSRPTVSMRGRALLSDGSPARNVCVRASNPGFGGAYLARTAADGRFLLRVEPGRKYTLWVEDAEWAAPTRLGWEPKAGTATATAIAGVDFRLEKGTLIRGVVTEGPDHRSDAGFRLTLFERSPDAPDLKIGADDPTDVVRTSFISTDDQGRYAIRVPPGKYAMGLAGRPGQEAFVIAGEAEIVRDFHLESPRSRLRFGRVTDGRGEPLADAKVVIWWGSSFHATRRTDANGGFQATCPTRNLAVSCVSRDGGLAGLAILAAEEREFSVRLQPSARATGELVDAAGRPLAGWRLFWNYMIEDPADARISMTSEPSAGVACDEQGRFSSPPLVVGREYTGVAAPVAGGPSDTIILRMRPEKPGVLDLGKIVVGKPARAVGTAQRH